MTVNASPQKRACLGLIISKSCMKKLNGDIRVSIVGGILIMCCGFRKLN